MRVHILTRDFAARICDKYTNLVNSLIYDRLEHVVTIRVVGSLSLQELECNGVM